MEPVIHINLIPLREIRRADRRRLHCLWGVTAIALTVTSLVALTWRALGTESGLTAQVRTSQQTVAAGKLNTTTAERLKKELDTYREALSTLREIGQPGTTHDDVLRGVATLIPSPLWLTRLALRTEQLTLEGRATGHAVVARFLQELEANSRFADNELVEVRQPKEGTEHRRKSFSIQSRIVNHPAKHQKDRATLE